MKTRERVELITEMQAHLNDALERLAAIDATAKFDAQDDENLLDAWEAARKTLMIAKRLPSA
jgi:hypothetical protein